MISCSSSPGQKDPPELPPNINLQDSVYSLIKYTKPKTSQKSEISMESSLEAWAQKGITQRKPNIPTNLLETKIELPPPLVRVFLFTTSSDILVKSIGSLQVEIHRGDSVVNLGLVRHTLVIQQKQGKVVILDHNNKVTHEGSKEFFLKSINPYNVFEVKGFSYRGDFLVKATPEGLTVINYISLENYLRGVLPYEIPVSDRSTLEAIKAQAVAARTYTMKHMGQFDDLGFDMYPDQRDQMYQGTSRETFLSDLAVSETEGILLQYKNELAATYYHSTCGGKTAGIHEVWKSEPVRYLSSRIDLMPDQTKYCAKSSYSNWSQSWPLSQITRMIKNYLPSANVTEFPNFNRLKNISIKEKTESGRVKTLLIETDKGDIEVYGDKIRWLFRNKKNQDQILPSSLITQLKFSSTVTIEGMGFGHGIGLCQFGALMRARRGESFTAILAHYYFNAELVKMPRVRR